MADEFDLEAVIRYSVQGQERVDQSIGAAQRSLDALRKSGKITDDQFDSLARTFVQAGNAAKDKYSKGVAQAVLNQGNLNHALEQSVSNLPRLRYAMYDVATTYGVVSAASLALVGATYNVAASYESAFSAVERTTLQASGTVSNSIGSIRKDLLALSTEIPLSFQELSNIASLGAQLGIAEGDLASFTDTVAKFSATTNVSIDETAKAFGRLGNLLNVPASQYENLGSAIALVGVNSAATESEIIAVAQNIAAVGASAGLSAEEVIALSGTFASLGTAPELARSVTQQFFGQLNRAVAEGGDQLQKFATVTGLTADKVASLTSNGQGFEVFNALLKNIASSNGPQVVTVLDELGLASLRTEQGIQRLRQNTDLLTDSLAQAKQGFGEGVFLDQAFAKILEDAASQMTLLGNAMQNLIAVAGGPFLEFVKQVAPPLIEVVKWLTELASTDGGQAFLKIAGGVTALVGVLAALKAAQYLATASTYALVTAQSGLASSGIRTGLGGLIQLLFGVTYATDAAGKASVVAATKVQTLKNAFAALGKATIVLGVLYLITQAVTDFGGTLETLRPILVGVADILSGWFGFLGDIAIGMSNFAQSTANAIPPLSAFFNLIAQGLNALGQGSKLVNGKNINAGITGIQKSLSGGSKAANDFASAASGAALGTAGFSSALGGLGGAAGGAAREVRTLVDYANDLQGVFSRAFDIRYKAALNLDDVNETWATLADRIDEAQRKLSGLIADRNIKEYFKSVADAYGDSLRGDKLAAEIADLNSQIAETQADASTELNGNTKAARQNRKQLTDLVKQYEDYITALAEGGADQATLNAAVASSKAAFTAQAQALGYSNAQIQPYIASFNDMTTAINRVPRNITVTANVDPAIQALNEFAAKAASAGASAGAGFANGMNAGLQKVARGTELQNQIAQYQATLAQYLASGNISGARYLGQAIAELSRKLQSGSYATGGYTGAGGKYEVAGVVHRGEYVVPKEQVNQRTGLPYASALGQLQTGTRGNRSGGFASGGFAASGGMIELGPSTRSWMRQHIAAEVNVAVGEQMVATAASNGSRQIYRRGGGQ